MVHMNKCDVYWGSHGCDLEEGHEGQHICLSCCDQADWSHKAEHDYSDGAEGIFSGCVGTWPYYGREAMDGPEAVLPFFRYEEANNMPNEWSRMEQLHAEWQNYIEEVSRD